MSPVTLPIRTRKLRTALALVGLGAALAAAGVMKMPAAQADPDGLVAWAHDNGFQATSTAIGFRGALVCADIANGYDGEEAATDLWLNTGIADRDDARQFVIAAVDNLCPQFDHRHDAPAPTTAPAPAIGEAYRA